MSAKAGDVTSKYDQDGVEVNPLQSVDIGTHWCYVDYKHLVHLLGENHELLKASQILVIAILLFGMAFILILNLLDIIVVVDSWSLSCVCLQSVDWTSFGFPERTGVQSTFWFGSDGACTPCHYDTYGCNLVLQVYNT